MLDHDNWVGLVYVPNIFRFGRTLGLIGLACFKAQRP